jgi:hypothetical protein
MSRLPARSGAALAAAVPLLLLSACALSPSGPPPMMALAPAGAEATFDCAMRELNERNFTVTAADRASGFLRAERDASSFGDVFLGGYRRLDTVTVAVYNDVDGRAILRVSPEGAEVHERGTDAGARKATSPTDDGIAAAAGIQASCGDPITEPA